MRVIRWNSGTVEAPSVVTVGKFDGVHVGHQALIASVRREADGRGFLAGAVTFDRHPAEALFPNSAPSYLTPLPEKLALLEETGLDFCVVLPVASGILSWDPDRFTEEIVRGIASARVVVAGPDFRFGREREGSVETLREAGIEVCQAEPVMVSGRRVSSFSVRHTLHVGDLELVQAMLGRAHSVSGTVRVGKQLGRTLGWPTANVAFEERVALPALGIYVVTAAFDGVVRPAVASLGVRPTLEGEAAPVWLEVHVIDWAGDLYGRPIRVTFHRRLRDERRFLSVEELKAQIGRDVDDARAYFRNGTESHGG